MKSFDLSQLNWQLSGWMPHHWRFSGSMETGATSLADIPAVPALIPGSVQLALHQANVLPDWNVGLNARECEWVENRHWIYETILPGDWIQSGKNVRLCCEGLDYSGWVLLNGVEVGAFSGSFIPHQFDLTPQLINGDNRLSIVFDCAPRWLGQFGYTSQMTQWKPRFNYFWDWTSRLVQVGIWDTLSLRIGDDYFSELQLSSDTERNMGILRIGGKLNSQAASSVHMTFERNGEVLRHENLSLQRFEQGVEWRDLAIELWQPNGQGDQPLYDVRFDLLDEKAEILDSIKRRIGFKQIEWIPCEGAPAEADPWLCVVNGTQLFLQGVNWTPIRPNFADVTREDYRVRLAAYRDMGCNMLRVWGGAFLEKSDFYELCDEMGFLVWQEFPLSSSGVENWPPEDEQSLEELGQIAQSYIARRVHHVSLALWCGGNELQGAPDGSKVGIGKPVTMEHPLMQRFGEIVAQHDPTRRFLPSSSSGPRFTASESEFGHGLHWDVHGPWGPPGAEVGDWIRYWQQDDALFRSETGAAGASNADLIRSFKGELDEMPATLDNPLWRRTSWWIEEPEFRRQHGRQPHDLDEYVAWSQQRQSEALAIAVSACKNRFPRCGGILLWMGHDSFPCAANTSIIDFRGDPKPAAQAISDLFRSDNEV